MDVVCVDTLVTGAAEHQVTDHLTGRAEETKVKTVNGIFTEL